MRRKKEAASDIQHPQATLFKQSLGIPPQLGCSKSDKMRQSKPTFMILSKYTRKAGYPTT